MKHLIIASLLLTTCYLKVNAQLFGRSYTAGYYYNKNGEKISGLVNAKPEYKSKIYFKKDEDAKVEKIDFEDFLSVVVIKSNDSLSVQSTGKVGKGLYLAIVASESAKIKLYYKTFPERNSAPTMTVGVSPVMGSRGSQPAFTNNLGWKDGRIISGFQKIMYEKDGTTFELTKSNYENILGEAFADKKKIADKIPDTKFKNIRTLIIDYNNAKKFDVI